MADTIQIASWALAQKCALRPGPDWKNPDTAFESLGHFKTYSQLQKNKGRGFGVFGDVCVFSTTQAHTGDTGPYYYYPSGGFILSSRFFSFGGLPALHQLCGNCPANDEADDLAGCTGYLSQSLYSKELDEQIVRLTGHLGLDAKLDSFFPPTHLQWFRFWIHSPIPADAVQLLQQLFEALNEEYQQKKKSANRWDDEEQFGLPAFIRALRRSASANIPLHVNLSPPGHTDLGWHTVFPHCPRCKAAAPVKRWQGKYRDEEIACEICGAKYSPAKTHSSTPYKWDREQLRELLGQTEFEKFAAQYLVARGASETEAARVVQLHEAWERERTERWRKETEGSRQNERFVENVIYPGLNNLSTKSEGEPAWLFSPADVEELFRRCKTHGGKVIYISHSSASGENDEFVKVSWPTSAKKTFQKLREKGCNEKFSVSMKFPPQVVTRWLEQQAK
jgi:hypothetical protein